MEDATMAGAVQALAMARGANRYDAPDGDGVRDHGFTGHRVDCRAVRVGLARLGFTTTSSSRCLTEHRHPTGHVVTVRCDADGGEIHHLEGSGPAT